MARVGNYMDVVITACMMSPLNAASAWGKGRSEQESTISACEDRSMDGNESAFFIAFQWGVRPEDGCVEPNLKGNICKLIPTAKAGTVVTIFLRNCLDVCSWMVHQNTGGRQYDIKKKNK